jgi:hypothetical protein
MESIIAIIKQYAMKAQSGLSGIQATLVSLFIDYVVNQIKKLWQKREVKKEFDQKLEAYESSVKDESLSKEKKDENLDSFLK